MILSIVPQCETYMKQYKSVMCISEKKEPETPFPVFMIDFLPHLREAWLILLNFS